VVFRIKETDNTFSEEQVDSLKEIVKKLNNLDPLLAEKILQITEDLKSRNRPFEKENNSNLKVAEIKNEVERIEEGKLTASAIRKELERLRKQIEGVRGNTTGKEIEIKKLLEEIEEKLVFYGAYPIDEIKAIIPEEFLSFAENNFKPERFLKVIWGKLEDSGYGYEKLGKEEKDRLEKEVRKKLEKTIEQFNKFGLTLFYPEITEIYELSGELGEFIRYVYLYIDIKNKEQKRNSQQGQTKDGGTSTTSGQASLIFDILSSSATERKELWNIKGVLKTLTQMIQNKERIDEEYPIDSWINMLEILWLSTPEYSPEIKDVLLAIANSEMYSPQTQQKALFATRNDQKLDGGAVFSDLFSNILERIKENHAIVNRWGKLLEVNSSAELIDSVNKEFEVYNQMKNALEELQKLILKETKNDKQFQESLQGKIVVALNVLEVALRQQISLAEQLILKYDISPEKTAELRNVLLKSEENILPILNDALNSIIKQLSRYIEEQQNNQLETNKDGREEVGGIDFRILPFLHNQINKPTNIIVPEHLMNLELHQMQNYWQSLEKKAYTETFPYQQIKEFVVACNNRNDCKELLVTVSAFLVHILKLEEEAAVPTAKELKEILCCIG
ncbi:MAG: hypothetical protein N2606_04445, partial [Candidatus Omnitrophica bacterium]|nr:hypothetical protein [Candidatus Omnitrophota bacterium]